MVGDCYLRRRIIPNKGNVASLLAMYTVSKFVKNSNTIMGGYVGNFSHAAIGNGTVSISGGMGCPVSLKHSMWSSMASLMLTSASWRVFPWDIQTGKEGHSATQ